MSVARCLLPVLLAGCAASAPSIRETTQAVLWVQSSAEYAAAVRQSYALAQRRLEEALAGKPASPAVVLDLDETVLDNSGFEAGLVSRDQEFTLEAWRAWLAGTGARAVPGAVEFVRHARSLGVEVYFVTNRPQRFREPTLLTLAKLGLKAGEDAGLHLWMRDEQPGWTDDKTSRREAVAAKHALVLLVGDDLNDFVDCTRRTPAQRRELALQHADRFGKDWILLPSPIWGSWLESVFGYQDDLPAAQRRVRQLGELRRD